MGRSIDTPCWIRLGDAYPRTASAAVALHRSPAGFLVDADEAAAIIEQIASNQERCLQVLFFSKR
jgi:hypothetical protein